MSSAFRGRAIVLVAVFVLAGCGGAQETTPAAPPVVGLPLSRLSNSNELLYVANFSGSVTTYDLQTYYSDPQPIRTISQPQPFQIAFNAKGYLFVVTPWWSSESAFPKTNFREPKTGFIGVYAPGSTKLERTITDGLDGPRALAIDSSGNLYVANSLYNSYVTVYSAPKYKLVATIDSNTVGTSTLALDSAQNLYVAQGSAYDNSSIMVYAHKTLKLIRTITNGIACPSTLAFDREDRLYVANNIANACGDSVTVYGQNSSQLLQTITDGIHTPEGLAFDSHENLYVGNNSFDSVTVYGPKARGLKYTITNGMDRPDALAFDSQGNLAVAVEAYNSGGVAIIPRGAKKPISVIQKGVDDPASVAFSFR